MNRRTSQIFQQVNRGLKRTFFLLLSAFLMNSVSIGMVLANSIGQAGGIFEAGPKFQYFKYEEPDVMETSGFMYGAFADYTYRTQENGSIGGLRDMFSSNSTLNVFSVEGSFVYGSVDYDSNDTGSIDGINDYVLEVRTLAGYDFPVGERSLITPYIGFGYRYWHDGLDGKTSSTGQLGYERESNYFYLPIGLKAAMPLNNDWAFGANAEFDVFLHGIQKSHLEDVSSSLTTLKNDQNSGFGVRGSVSLTKTIDKFNFIIEPFIRYWDIDDSSSSLVGCAGSSCIYGYEPKNNTIEAGVSVGAQF